MAVDFSFLSIAAFKSSTFQLLPSMRPSYDETIICYCLPLIALKGLTTATVGDLFPLCFIQGYRHRSTNTISQRNRQ